MSHLDLTVAGLGLVSPVATTPRAHAFLIRAEAAMHAGRAFVDGSGEPLEVLHCPLVDPQRPLAERLSELGDLALTSILAPLDAWPGRRSIIAQLVVPELEPPLDGDLFARCEASWAERHQLRFGARSVGAASVYQALAAAPEAFQRGVSGLLLLALDTAAHPAILEQRLRPVSRWMQAPPRLSEAAAALLVVPRADGLPTTFGKIRYAGVAMGVGSDRDDDPSDGRAMTALLRHAATTSPLPWGNSYGPFTVDSLRRKSFHAGLVRNRHAFALDGEQICVEHAIGRVGAASALAAPRLRARPSAPRPPRPPRRHRHLGPLP
ncbi:MAG: hypothetical protein R3B72_51340 [Polyangiaceae bacterium]